MSVINTNVKAMVAQNSMNVNNRALSTSMEQLSTGKRINSAKDDAAGLAISSRMTAQIRGLNQAVRNANDGITLLQTAEGATIEMSNMLQRMRELAVQSANDTNTQDDRNYLDLEYQQLMKEITRIAGNTEWNGMNLLNNTDVGVSGTANDVGQDVRNVKFQVGANSGQVINVGLKDFSFSTGTAPTTSEVQINLSNSAAFSGKTFTIDFASSATTAQRTFTVTASADLTSGNGAAIAADLDAKLESVIRSTVGFENVEIVNTGSTLKITDTTGRRIGTFTAANASGAAIAGASAALTETASGALAQGGGNPTAQNAIFKDSAQLNDTSITSQANANTAINRLDVAINRVNNERAMMGAVINRLTYAADNLANVSQNTSESRSRILDTDYAAATTELARTQIIQQAATAMLAQANQQPQSVLSLLK